MEHHIPVFRRMIAAAVSAAMLMTMAACSEAPAGTNAPQHKPTVTQPQEQPGRDPAATQPRETEPAAQTHPTESPTTEPGEIGPEDLVSDAYRYIWEDDDGYECCYHIPRINLGSCTSANDDIFRTLFAIIDRDAEQSITEYGEPSISRMSYIWNYADGVVSILVEIPDYYVDWEDYIVYYVSAETGDRLEKADLLDAYGLSEREFHDQVYAALDAYWQELLASGSFQDNDQLTEMTRQTIEQTLADENIQAAVPFIHTDGDLSFLASVFVPAGGGEFRGLFDCDTGALLDHYECTVDHASPVTP